MIIAFFGHADYTERVGDKETLLSLITTIVGSDNVHFYLGGYGNFDYFALRCCDMFKTMHENATTVFVTPYLDASYWKLKNAKGKYDESVYPPIESLPKRYAISKRNEWMIEQADWVIVYVDRSYGGAYSAMAYAERKGKPIVNLFAKF